MHPAGLTEQAAKALTFIQGFIDTHGWSPSYREITQAVGWKSVSNAHRMVDILVDRGYLAKRADATRSLSVLRRVPGSAATNGAVPASLNLARYQEIEESLLRSYTVFSGENPDAQLDMALRRLAVAFTALPDNQALIHRLGLLVRVLTNVSFEISKKTASAF